MRRNALIGISGLVLGLLPAAARAQDLPPAERYYLRGEYWRWSVNLDSEFQKGFGTAEGTVIDGTETLEQVGRRIFEKIVAVAGGEKTKSELAGIGRASCRERVFAVV